MVWRRRRRRRRFRGVFWRLGVFLFMARLRLLGFFRFALPFRGAMITYTEIKVNTIVVIRSTDTFEFTKYKSRSLGLTLAAFLIKWNIES